MTQQHPDLAAEQALVDHAYDCLERSRQDAWKLRDMSEPGSVELFRLVMKGMSLTKHW